MTLYMYMYCMYTSIHVQCTCILLSCTCILLCSPSILVFTILYTLNAFCTLTLLLSPQLPSERLDGSDPALPPYSLSSFTSFPVSDPPLSSLATLDLPSLPPPSSSYTSSISSLDLPPFASSQPSEPQHQTPTGHQFYAPRLSHPPTVTSTPFPISSLSANQFQQPIQMLNSLQPSVSLPPPLPPFSTPSHPPPSHLPFSTSSHPPSSHLPFSTPALPPSRFPPSNFCGANRGTPPSINTNYTGLHSGTLVGDGMGKSPVVSTADYPLASGMKFEDGIGGRRRTSSISGPPLDDQGEQSSSTCMYMYNVHVCTCTIHIVYHIHVYMYMYMYMCIYSTAHAEPKCESHALNSRGLEWSVTRVFARHGRVLVRNELTLRTRGRGCNARRLHVERAVTDARLFCSA